MSRDELIELAKDYIAKSKGFRAFENDNDVDANLSPIIWSEAAKQLGEWRAVL
jgi:hypothetical protein